MKHSLQGGSHVNLISEERGADVLRDMQRTEEEEETQQSQSHGQRLSGAVRTECCFQVKEGWEGCLDLLGHAIRGNCQ